MTFLQSARAFLVKRGPGLLTGFGILGFLAAIGTAVQATPKALAIIHEGELTEPKQVVKHCWQLYMPCAVLSGLSIACIIAAHSIHGKKIAALTSAYALGEKAFTQYKDSVKKVLGDKKEEAVKEHIAKVQMTDSPMPDEGDVIQTGGGSYLCYEALTGRWFRSDRETLRRIENDVNQKLNHGDLISIGDVFFLMGLPDTGIGEMFAWDMTAPGGHPFEFEFSSTLNSKGEPALYVGFKDVWPSFNFR